MEEVKKTTTKTKTTAKIVTEGDTSVKTENKTQSEIDNLKQQLNQMNLLVQQLLASQSMNNMQNTDNRQKLNTFVKIIHLVQRGEGLSTYMKLSNLEINLTQFGEERSLEQQQFEELLGKYRHWFDSGLISVAAGYDDVAERYGLKTAAQYPLDSELIKNLGVLNMSQIEEIYKKLPESGKTFILSHWKLKVLQGDTNFKDIRKIETLNRISNGGMDNVIIDLKNQK